MPASWIRSVVVALLWVVLAAFTLSELATVVPSLRSASS